MAAERGSSIGGSEKLFARRMMGRLMRLEKIAEISTISTSRIKISSRVKLRIGCRPE